MVFFFFKNWKGLAYFWALSTEAKSLIKPGPNFFRSSIKPDALILSLLALIQPLKSAWGRVFAKLETKALLFIENKLKP